MKISLIRRTMMATSTLIALVSPLPVQAGPIPAESCPGYVEALSLAREALGKGNRAQSILFLKRAQSELELCQHRSEKPGEKIVG